MGRELKSKGEKIRVLLETKKGLVESEVKCSNGGLYIILPCRKCFELDYEICIEPAESNAQDLIDGMSVDEMCETAQQEADKYYGYMVEYVRTGQVDHYVCPGCLGI